MAGDHICCLCDNAAMVVMINKHTSKHSVAMHLFRCLFICARFNITLTAEHIAGITNEEADALSRNNLPAFFLKVPFAHQTPSVIPPALLEILVNQSPNWLSAVVQHFSSLPLSRLWGILLTLVCQRLCISMFCVS